MVNEWYHGTNESSAKNICDNGIDFSKSKKELDFGIGFYLTDDKFVAEKRANQKTKIFNRIHKVNESPAIVKVIIDDSAFNELQVKKFDCCDNDWAGFVIANRLPVEYLNDNRIMEHNHDLRYDVVLGSIADSDVSELVRHINNGHIGFDDVSAYELLTDGGTTLGLQMSLHTLKGLECVKEKSYELTEGRKIK